MRTEPGMVVGVVLAGGRSTRMGGGDKCLRRLGDRSVLQHIVDRLHPQVDHLILNVNGPPQRFTGIQIQTVQDVVDDGLGPLAGILTGMEWARRNLPGCNWIATVPSDTPFLPRNLVDRLFAAARGQSGIVRARSSGRSHHAIGIWPVSLATPLRDALIVDGVRAVNVWAARYLLAEAEFAAEDGMDPFFNINRPDDLAVAEAFLRAD